MSAVVQMHPTPRQQVAEYLRDLADAIERGDTEVEPYGVIVCITGEEHHEAMWRGHHEDGSGFWDAVDAIPRIACAPFPHQGRIRHRKPQGGRKPVPCCGPTCKRRD